jgi:hypothetical protein
MVALIEQVKMMNLFCHACNEVFAIPARRGRPPKYCTNCINGGDAKTHEEVRNDRIWEEAQRRVDNLEMMLRSRGTHISQQAGW